jgi:hypothetical protein
MSVLMACSQSKVAEPTVVETSAHESAHESNRAVKAYVDPTTGELRDPIVGETLSNSNSSNKKPLATSPTEQLPAREIVHPGGIVEVPIDNNHQHALQACVQSDGSVKMGHGCAEASKAKP